MFNRLNVAMKIETDSGNAGLLDQLRKKAERIATKDQYEAKPLVKGPI